MKYLFLILLFSWQSTLITVEHEFHMSKCEIAFNEEEKALQIILHLFIDDLESALAEEEVKNLYICTDKEAEDAEQHIVDYLEQNFTLQVNGTDAAYTFLGKEVSEDLQAVWCYLEVMDIETLQELAIKNKLLISTFDDQKNIVSITSTSQGRKGYFLFDKKTFEDTVKF